MCCATIQNCTNCYFELLSRHALVLVCPLPEAEPVAGRETKLSATMSCPLPRIGDSRTVRQVADAHAAHGTRYGPLDLGMIAFRLQPAGRTLSYVVRYIKIILIVRYYSLST